MKVGDLVKVTRALWTVDRDTIGLIVDDGTLKEPEGIMAQNVWYVKFYDEKAVRKLGSRPLRFLGEDLVVVDS
jgi:hypothetical protein